MGKKGRRHQQKKYKKDVVEPHIEEKESAILQESKRCPHLGKAVKLGVLQNQVPHIKVGQCSQCRSSNSEDTGVCICLRCAKQGCDRYSQDQHALCHNNECPSHNITLHLQSMIAWCYGCDMEVPVVPDSDLHECVKLLIKTLNLNLTNDHKLAIPKIRASSNSEVQQVNNHIISPSNKLSQKIKGLVNLGNTCFFNAVMQNLNQTELLHLGISFVNQSEYSQRIVGREKMLDVHVTNPAGSLLVSLNKLLGDFRSSTPGPLNPKFLFSEICKKAPRFKGFQQQDSQELLRYLLDSIKTDQLKRVKLGVLKHFEVTEGVEIKSFPADKKEKIKEYVHLVTAPCIDSVFAGKLDSIVVCHKCHKESRVTESFLDLSLSLIKPQEQTTKSKSGKPSKMNSVPSVEKKNSADETKEVKQTPLSKHQQKVAREAKRKKGRKKGKQRTNSRSSEDGFNEVEVKHEFVENKAINASSEHERQQGDINDCRSNDSEENTQNDKEDNRDLASEFGNDKFNFF